MNLLIDGKGKVWYLHPQYGMQTATWEEVLWGLAALKSIRPPQVGQDRT